MIYFALNMLDYAKFAVIFAAAASMAVAAVRHREWRKARRFLARLRAKYNIRDVTIRQLEEERRHAAAVV